jgi:2-hydroxy-3-keto-5-methylthiopentenyl-1-phosphate phosphatase
MSPIHYSTGSLLQLHHRVHVLVDFDGTIVPDDATDSLLDQFADPAWRAIEAAWQAGVVSSRECLGRQVGLLRATPRELDAAIRSLEIDPDFPAFLNFCRCNDIEVTIVSDGFDRVVRSVLERAQLSTRFFANKLTWQGGDRWRLEFPFSRSDCRSSGANCKCSHRSFGHGRHVVVGDGRSDFCMALHADYVICKGSLKHFCRDNRVHHATFDTFDDVSERLEEWLNGFRDVGAEIAPAEAGDAQRERFAQRETNG